ncbi:hypothetical protein Misp01_07940 [Microtetraspora sp. NBRC 13810]|nr:hypothetical protein Misp01_07940 [Microtetraspora sp. NBRC 13810]
MEAPASEEERRVAFIDATCQTGVNLVGTYKTLRTVYEERLVTDHKADLAASKLIFQRWLDTAREITNKGY